MKEGDYLSQQDSLFLASLRGFLIFIIVFGHIGGFWFYKPYSAYLHAFVPTFFFVSGSVLYFSYGRSLSIFNYYLKRSTGLLVPYYLICIFSIIVFIIVKKSLPEFNLSNFVKWIQIRPSNDIMPFPLGQVWFLHTLFILILISPVYFKLIQKKSMILFFIVATILFLSILQHFKNISHYFYFFGNNFYKPIFHSSFFIFGAIYFSNKFKKPSRKFLAISTICLFFLELLIVYLIKNPDYEFHTYSPDFYYLIGSFCVITFLLTFKNRWVDIINSFMFIKNTLSFFYKHTFSIFLLHSFAVFISEEIFGIVHPSVKTIKYGVTKLSVVLLITCCLSIPFTRLSKYVIGNILVFSSARVLDEE